MPTEKEYGGKVPSGQRNIDREEAGKPAGEILEVRFYDRQQDSIEDEKLQFAVILSKTEGKWVFCKHRERTTYEIPGGRREKDEQGVFAEEILQTARRELWEETGALEFDIKPLCVYSVVRQKEAEEGIEETFGMLYFADIRTFEKELYSEIEKIMVTEELPSEWTYPSIQPKLFAKAREQGI